jgi:hypothetical protein
MIDRLLFLAAWCLLVQQAPQATQRPAVLQGQVTRQGAATPVAHARIVAAKVGGSPSDYRTGITDAKGRFAFDDLTPGTYRVYATREGYLQAEYGRRSVGASGVPIVLAEGQASPDLALSMTPTGVIAGRVFHQSGRPARSVWVRALKARYFDGERSLAVAEWAESDDRGEYRLFGLSPGSYFVAAVPRERPRIEGDQLVVPAMPATANLNQGARRLPLSKVTVPAAAFDRNVYPPVYHPGTIDAAGAQPVDVRAGEAATGIDLTIAAVTRTFNVRGHVSAVGAGPSPEFIVGMSAADGETFFRIPNAPLNAGSFDFPGIPPGRYRLTAQTKAPLLRDTIHVDVVDRDVDGLTVTLRPGVTVSGRLRIGQRPPGSMDTLISVQLQSSAGTYSTIRYESDGTFKIENVPPREYRLRVLGGPRSPWVKAARFGDDDVLNAPIRIGGDLQGRELEIVLGESIQTINAQVLDAERKPVAGVLVIAVPDAARRNQSRAYRSATTGADGHARIDGLAPGEYTLFASESIDAGDWQDPAVLQRQESRGTAVGVRDGETKTVTLRITS